MIKELLHTQYCGIDMIFEVNITLNKAIITQRITLDNSIIEKSKELELTSFGLKYDTERVEEICNNIAEEFKIYSEESKNVFTSNLTEVLISQTRCNAEYLSIDNINKIKSHYNHDKQFLSLQLINSQPGFVDNIKLNIRLYVYGLLSPIDGEINAFSYDCAEKYVYVEIENEIVKSLQKHIFVYYIEDWDDTLKISEGPVKDLLNDIIDIYIHKAEQADPEGCIVFGMDNEDTKKINKNDNHIIDIPREIATKIHKIIYEDNLNNNENIEYFELKGGEG